MHHRFIRYFCIVFLILLSACAKRGTITGGLKDTIAPTLRSSVPKNFTTNFKGQTVKLTFSEYIKLKNINKQLIISPPMEKAPEVLPNNASKYLQIRFRDTLLENTTYSLNFGQSIEDNNEGNPYRQFKYVFSTGPYIDSLTLSGKIKDAREFKADNFVNVMLYEVDDNFSDSIIYKKKPRYITNTLDSLTSFNLENLKPGKYLLVALKDANSNYKFDPKEDKIAFHPEFITIPNDTVYQLELFKETPALIYFKPSQSSGNSMIIGYEGKFDNPKVQIQRSGSAINNIITKVHKKDSLQVWYPAIKLDEEVKTDSLQIKISDGTYQQDFKIKIKNQKVDTLSLVPNYKGILPLSDNYVLTSSIPIIKIDKERMQLTNKDSIAIPFSTTYAEMSQEIIFNFEKEPLQKYKLKLLPNAVTDYMEQSNDTLSFNFETKNVSEYGNLRLTLENVRQFPIIVELTNSKGEVLYSQYSKSSNQVEFNLITPALFTVRVIYDQNGNKQWDTGSYLLKKQSEEVIYGASSVDVRANWDVEQTINLKQ